MVAGLRSICPARDGVGDQPLARRVAARRGYTLVELLIVVALLSVILSLTLPSVRQLAAKSELQDAARLVRVRLLEARLEAIDTGGITYFRYELGGDQFEVGRAGALSSGGPAAGTEEGLLDLSGAGVEAVEPQRLPLGMRFVDPAADPAADPPQETPSAEDRQVGEPVWSEPLLFFPNGRTLNAHIAICSAWHRARLSVRGLTGTVQVSRAERLASDTRPEMESEPVPSVSVSSSAEGAPP